LKIDKIRRKQGGFTLVEVLIGLVLLAVGILAVAALQVTSVRGNFNSSNLMQATYIAQDTMESLRNRDFTLVPATSDVSNTTDHGVTFTRIYNVSAVIGGLRTITCTVTWNDGVNHSITFSTMRSQ
jgi:type IV pilus assembly protein PilV